MSGDPMADELDGVDETIDADLDVAADGSDDVAEAYFARQHAAKAAQEAAAARRQALRPPAPEVPATALTRALLADRGASAAVQLWDAAAAAGWSVAATYARGPLATEKTLCPACLTWAKITKAGVIGVHGQRDGRCQRLEPDPASPAYQIVDSIIVRAVSPARPAHLGGGVHRLAATWLDDGDDPSKAQYAAAGAKLWHPGDRPRDCDVVAVRTALRATAAGRKPVRASRARRAA